MASATYLQSLDTVYEDGTSRGVTPSNRRQVETFIATEAIAIGEVVAFKFTNGSDPGLATLQIKKAAADSHSFGVALQAAAASGDQIEVCIGGICEAKVKGAKNSGAQAISSGDFLALGDVAGTYYQYGAGTDASVDAIAIDDVGSGATATVSVIVIKKF